jgi:hypothetical protein
MRELFAPIAMKVAGGIIGALLLVIAFQAITLRAEKHHSAKVETRLHESEAAAALFASRVEAKSNAILAKAEVNARRVETAQAQIQQETDHEIRTRIASAVAAARLRTNPASSAGAGSGAGQGASAPDTPGDTAGDGQTALVRASDLTACAEAYVKATGWQAWWQSVSAIERQGEVR